MTPAPELEILFQDEFLIAINKPAGHLVHPADEPKDDDLVAMKILRDQIGQKVYTIHRLDRPTCGVLLFGLEPSATKKLHRALEDHSIKKSYQAIIEGIPPLNSWTCEEPLQKSSDKPEQEAKTDFTVIECGMAKGIQLTKIACRLHTGRFHQIRKHLLHCGHPIVGDYRYATIEHSDYLSTILQTDKKMLLQASDLTFAHPITNDSISIQCPEPDYFPVLTP